MSENKIGLSIMKKTTVTNELINKKQNKKTFQAKVQHVQMLSTKIINEYFEEEN